MGLSDFLSFYQKYKEAKVVIATHENADIDALASAYALSHFFPNSVIAVPTKANEEAEHLSKVFGIRYVSLKELKPGDFEGIIAVDTSSKTLLPVENWKVLCIIDHHKTPPDIEGECIVKDEKAGATAQIIAELFLQQLPPRIAEILAIAILSDTVRFKRGDERIFRTFSQLLEKGEKSYEELLDLAFPEKSEDTKMAVLKALQRVEYKKIGPYIVATSHIGNKESIAASLLVEIADISFVASYKEEEKVVRISARARPNVKVALNKVMKEVGKALGGDGGGHEKAAGACGKATEKEALEKCLEILEKFV